MGTKHVACKPRRGLEDNDRAVDFAHGDQKGGWRCCPANTRRCRMATRDAKQTSFPRRELSASTAWRNGASAAGPSQAPTLLVVAGNEAAGRLRLKKRRIRVLLRGFTVTVRDNSPPSSQRWPELRFKNGACPRPNLHKNIRAPRAQIPN